MTIKTIDNFLEFKITEEKKLLEPHKDRLHRTLEILYKIKCSGSEWFKIDLLAPNSNFISVRGKAIINGGSFINGTTLESDQSVDVILALPKKLFDDMSTTPYELASASGIMGKLFEIMGSDDYTTFVSNSNNDIENAVSIVKSTIPDYDLDYTEDSNDDTDDYDEYVDYDYDGDGDDTNLNKIREIINIDFDFNKLTEEQKIKYWHTTLSKPQ